MPVERDAVIWGYRLLLGRSPENESEIQEGRKYENVDRLCAYLVNRPAYRARVMPLLDESYIDPFDQYERDCTVFLHVPKAGGSTVTDLLTPHFSPERICPAVANLHTYSPAALSKYDFYAGHFDWFSLRYIPKARKKVFSIFRSPRERLVSLYYFAKAHPPKAGFPLFANNHTIEEFFNLPIVRSHGGIWNHYAMAFGASGFSVASELVDRNALLVKAVDNIRGLDAVGVTERMGESVVQIFKQLRLPAPAVVYNYYDTERMSEATPELSPIKKEPISKRLDRILDDLVCLDEQIYAEVLSLFESRREESVQAITAVSNKKLDTLLGRKSMLRT